MPASCKGLLTVANLMPPPAQARNHHRNDNEPNRRPRLRLSPTTATSSVSVLALQLTLVNSPRVSLPKLPPSAATRGAVSSIPTCSSVPKNNHRHLHGPSLSVGSPHAAWRLQGGCVVRIIP